MSGSRRHDSVKCLQQRAAECRENGYLLSAKKIGSGAFSKVYLGYATPTKICHNYKLANDLRSKNHNMVAIKIISINEAPPEYSKKFLHREIYALNTTYRHPGVIQLYEVFRSSRRVYLVLELALRGDLLEHVNGASLARGRPGLDEDEARRIFTQIVTAVTHCHGNRIVHRDLKCENILLDEQGFVKLTDFGFANHFSDPRSLMSTFCGSVAYTAPEILLSRKYNGAQADLWSLGVILFAMVTGKLPYQERQPRRLVQLLRKDLPFHTPVSTGCQDLIRKLLQWTPSSRLPLCQVTAHPWLRPSAGATPPCKLRLSKSDITHKDQAELGPDRPGAPDRKPKDGVFLAQGAVTGRSCFSGPTPPPRPPRPVLRPPGLPDGPASPSPAPPPRLGARSADGGGRGREWRREEPLRVLLARPAPPPPPPCVSTTTRLFTRRPRPPSGPRPFHNLPNFRKPGSAREGAGPRAALHSLCTGKMADGGVAVTAGNVKYCFRTPPTGC